MAQTTIEEILVDFQGEMDCAPYTICRKMKGTREWKLWECLEIKRIIGSSMPIEELFKVG